MSEVPEKSRRFDFPTIFDPDNVAQVNNIKLFQPNKKPTIFQTTRIMNKANYINDNEGVGDGPRSKLKRTNMELYTHGPETENFDQNS